MTQTETRDRSLADRYNAALARHIPAMQVTATPLGSGRFRIHLLGSDPVPMSYTQMLSVVDSSAAREAAGG